VRDASMTIAVVKYEPKRLIIAADSQSSIDYDAKEKKDNLTCKIATLGSHAAFVAAGFVGYNNNGPRDAIATWRAADVAREAFGALLGRYGEWRDRFLYELAITIGDELARRTKLLAQFAANNVARAVEGGLLTTCIVATSCDPVVSAAVIQVGVDPIQGVVRLPLQYVSSALCPPCAIGKGQIVVELLQLSSSRAKAAMQKIWLEMSELPEGEREIRRITRFAEKTVEWLPPDAGVGGPIDVLELRAEQGWRWVQKKAECQ
jgi:hypothetical protein